MAGCTRSIDIGTSLNQELHNLGVAEFRSNEEASEPTVQSWKGLVCMLRNSMTGLTMSMDICAFINQDVHYLKVTIYRGKVEARYSIQPSNLGEHM
jgi:hypothetical protein